MHESIERVATILAQQGAELVASGGMVEPKVQVGGILCRADSRISASCEPLLIAICESAGRKGLMALWLLM